MYKNQLQDDQKVKHERQNYEAFRKKIEEIFMTLG